MFAVELLMLHKKMFDLMVSYKYTRLVRDLSALYTLIHSMLVYLLFVLMLMLIVLLMVLMLLIEDNKEVEYLNEEKEEVEVNDEYIIQMEQMGERENISFVYQNMSSVK
mgnify:CR=1 FL=1